jgi:hypothetical protein
VSDVIDQVAELVDPAELVAGVRLAELRAGARQAGA